MTATVEAMTGVAGILSDAFSECAGLKGNASLEAAFSWASGSSAALGAAIQANPVESGSVLIAGLAAAVAFGPTVSAVIMTETIAGYLEGTLGAAGAESAATALTGYFATKTGETLYQASLAAIQGVVTALGGSTASVSGSADASGNVASNSSAAYNIILVSPGSTSGSINQTLINLPIFSQDANVIGVMTAGDASSPAAAAPEITKTDQYTGSSVTFEDYGVVHTATILYQNANGTGFYVNPSSGYFSVGNNLITSITPPSSNSSLYVDATTSTVQPDGGVLQETQGMGANNVNSQTLLVGDGGSANTVYNTQSTGSWISQTSIYNDDGQLIGGATLNNDGTTNLSQIDPATGKTYSVTLDAQGNPVTGSTYTNMGYSDFVSATIDALATQLISKVLIKNNLPASVVAQAFATATINSAVDETSGNFNQDFSTSVVNIAGGIAGSDVGALIAKDLDIPTEAGSIVGGVIGNVLTQAIVNEVLLELGLSALTDVALSSAASLAGAFGAGLDSAGAGLLGSYLGSLIAGNSLDANIGGAVGGAIGGLVAGVEFGAEAGSFLGPIGALVGAVIGALVGTLLGGLFDPPRGEPFVVTIDGISNGKFSQLGAGVDNNGNIADANSISSSLTGFLNQVLSNIGGTAISAASWDIGYGDDHGIFAVPAGSSSWDSGYKFSDINAAISAVAYIMLRSVQITGGNPIMMWELENSPATNINDLLTDLGIAQDYSIYQASPLLVAVAIAASGDPTQYTNLQNQLTAAQGLGLNRLTYNGVTLTIATTAALIAGDLTTVGSMPGTAYGFTFADTSANVLSELSILQAQAAGGHLASISFTDNTAPTLTLSAVQVGSNINALKALTGSYTINVTDTAANIAANLNALQIIAASGHLNALAMSDSGTPSITLSAVQIGSDATALGKISHAYKVVVQDTTANISANFAALQAAQAAGHLTSITATDSTKPVIAISYAQYIGGTATLALITTSYSFGLVDTGANAAANLSALQTLVTSGKLVSVKFTDATQPTISITVAQTTSYAALLALMAGSAALIVTGIAANTSYTFNNSGLTLALTLGVTIQSNGTNSFLDTLNGSNLAVTLASSKAVVDSSGNATFTTPLTGFGSSTLKLTTAGLATFTLGSDILTFQSNALQAVSYASGAFSFGVKPSSSAYTENVVWNPTTGAANMVVTAAGGQPVTTALGQINAGSTFSVVGSTISNTNSAGQLLLSTTVNMDGTQVDTVYNFSGGTNKDSATTYNVAGQETSIRWDHTDGSTYTTYVNPTTQAVIANLTINANGSGSVSTANGQTITFAAGNQANVSVGSAGDTLLTIKTLSGTGIVETFDLTSGQIFSTINGNVLAYSLANAGIAIDASGNVVIAGGGSTLALPANGANASFVVGSVTLPFAQNLLQSLSSVSGAYVFGLVSPAGAAGYSESLSWNPTTGMTNLITAPAGGEPTTTALGPINPGYVLSISGSTISIKTAGGVVNSSTTINADGSQSNTFNNSAGALHVGTDGTTTFIDGSDQLVFQPNTLISSSSNGGIFTFGIATLSSAYTESITWNPSNGMASLVLTATGKSAVTTSLGQVNPGTVFSVSSSTITNTNSAGQKLYSTTVNLDGSQVDTVYNYGGSTTDTVTTFNTSGQQTAVHYDNTNGTKYTSYYNPATQAVIANFSVNADGSGYVATNNNQTINFAAGNNASVSIGTTGDTILTTKTSSGNAETLDMSSGQIVSTINGSKLTYTLANAGGSIDASGNLTLTGGGSTILLPAAGGNATFTVGQDSISIPQNVLQSLSSVNNVYMFGVTSVATGFSETISWNPTNGMANLILTPTAGGAALTTTIGQINPGNVLSIQGTSIVIVSSAGAAIYATDISSNGSQLNTYYNNTNTVNETVTAINTAGQITSVRSDNANGSTYTSYYTPGTQTIMANRSVNADGSGYVATTYNQTVNFAANNVFGVTLDVSGNPFITITTTTSLTAETLDLSNGQIVSTIKGNSLTYTLPSPTINYDASGNLTLVASGSTIVIPSNGGNYIFSVGQDTISLNPTSVTSITPNGTGYNFNLKPVGTASEYVTWNPQTGIATLNITPSGGSLTSTNMGYINPGYVLNVSSSLITNTNASGVTINSYAVQSNGSVISTASSTTYSLAASSTTYGLSGSDTVTVSGSTDTIYESQSDVLTLSGTGNTIIAQGTGDTVNNSGNGTNTYDFGTGFGTQTITNAGSASGSTKGVVAFLSGITDENLWLKQTGSNLEIDLLGTTSKITLNNWYGSNAAAQVASLTANGVTLLEGQVAQLVSAMATYAANNTGFNVTTATAMPTNTALQTAIAAAWH